MPKDYKEQKREFENDIKETARMKDEKMAKELCEAFAPLEKLGKKKNKYVKNINGIDADVYDVLMAFEVTNPATAHAVKKLLMPGNRGYKDTIQDLTEAIASIERAIELEMMK